VKLMKSVSYSPVCLFLKSRLTAIAPLPTAVPDCVYVNSMSFVAFPVSAIMFISFTPISLSFHTLVALLLQLCILRTGRTCPCSSVRHDFLLSFLVSNQRIFYLHVQINDDLYTTETSFCKLPALESCERLHGAIRLVYHCI